MLAEAAGKCTFNQFCCVCRGHHCEWAPGDVAQLLLCRKAHFRSRYYLENAKCPTNLSLQEPIGKDVDAADAHSAMCFGNAVSSLFPGYPEHPSSWRVVTAESTPNAAGCRQARVGCVKSCGVNRGEQRSWEAQWSENAFTSIPEEEDTSKALL